MARIHRLPPAVITAIAAGETIERPAYVIKELIENALDAGATSIDIAFSQAGLERIRVYDNGSGMSPEDLALAPLPHTTSKITALDDLATLTTFGFRGEALASMSKVANVTLASRQATEDTGHVLQVYHGDIGEVRPHGMTKGTQVVVEQLFEHVPVRKKFLTNLQKERRAIVEIVTQQALSSPQVGFVLKDGNKVLLDLPAQQDLAARINFLFDQTTIEQLIPVRFHHSFVTINGYIGTPQLARKIGRHQYFFLNQRAVSFPVLSTVLRKAYGSLLQTGFVPWFLLHLELPPTMFDPNIHPRKEAVAFLDEAQVIALMNKAVVEALSSQNLSFQYQFPPVSPSATFQLRDKHSPLPELHQLLRQEVQPWSVTAPNTNQVLQIDNTYLLFPEDEGFTIIDQHAAHERILYEQFKAAFENKQRSTEDLNSQDTEPTTIALDPVHIINLNPTEDALWQEHALTLQTIGFAWQIFGPQSYQITHVPRLLADHSLNQVITQLLDDLAANLPLTITNQTHKTLAYLACRSAVMAGDPLSTEQAQRLITQLAATTNNATCPHGRPTRIHFAKDKLEVLFGRK